MVSPVGGFARIYPQQRMICCYAGRSQILELTISFAVVEDTTHPATRPPTPEKGLTFGKFARGFLRGRPRCRIPVGVADLRQQIGPTML